MDLQIGRGTSPISSYVALTRVRKCEDLLIYRSFDRELFTKGSPEGPELLLKTLRGECIDWKAIEEKHTPSKRCVHCDFVIFKDGFLATQWTRKDAFSCCKKCLQRKKDAGTPYECLSCHFWKSEACFASNTIDSRDCSGRRICTDCKNVLPCKKCGDRKGPEFFSETGWKVSFKRICMTCVRPDVKKCILCKEEKGKGEFSPDAWDHLARRRCKECVRPGVKKCIQCKEDKGESEFFRHAWEHPDDRMCKRCVSSFKGFWQCVSCKAMVEKSEFSKWLSKRACKTKNNGTARCNPCMDNAAESLRKASAVTQKHIQKRS